MPTLNSNEITRVYGSEVTITADTVKGGDDNLFNRQGGLQIAPYSFTSTAAGSGGDIINLTILPKDAVVVGATIRAEASFGNHASAAVTFRIDGTAAADNIGSAITVNTGGSSVLFASTFGNGHKVSGAGLVTMTQNAQEFNGSKAVEGEILYYVDGK